MKYFFIYILLNVLRLNAQDSWNVSLVYNWNDTSLPVAFPYFNIYNEIWGFQVNNHDYAVIGSTNGTHIFDVTNTDSIYERLYVPGADQGESIIHRDYHDYKGYLYMVCQEGASTIQILNISMLPDTAFLVYDSDSVFSQAHNIFIDTSSGIMYGGYVRKLYPAPTMYGMSAYDLSNPLSPVEIYDKNLNVHDIYARNDTVYLNAASDGLEVYDFSNPSSPMFLGSLTGYAFQGYNHSGWLTDDGKYYIMSDEDHGYPMKMCDVQNLNDIEVISHVSSGVDPNSIPHNQIIHGDYLYVAYYHDGLYVYDISDPLNVNVCGFYDTYLPADHSSYKGAWGVYPFLGPDKVLLSDMQTGLYVLDVTNALNYNIIEDRAKSEIKIYPNPSSGFININVVDNSKLPLKVKLFNVSGKMLFEKILHDENDQIKIGHLNIEGLVFCEVYADNGLKLKERIFVVK